MTLSQLRYAITVADSRSMNQAALTAARPIQPVNQMHQVHGNGQCSQNYNYIPNSSHNRYLQ